MCEEWNDYEKFYLWALNNGFDETLPARECTIDRIDNDGDYCPENCRWTTMKVQGRNTRRTVMLEYKGETKPLRDWADLIGIPAPIILQRIKVNGWSIEDALEISTEDGKKMNGRWKPSRTD
jgi:hypothetical protein